MSLHGLQQAFSILVASPNLCLELRENDAKLNRFDGLNLSPRDKRRLLAMARHQGMSHNCSLYRANRLTPIARALPGTCSLLGQRLMPELEAFWAHEPDSELQFKRESERFGRFLISRYDKGQIEYRALILQVRTELNELGISFA